MPAKEEVALRLVLPSDGALHQPTLDFFGDCGLPVLRPNSRRYTATIPALSGVEVLFQRTADITEKVEEGSAELGVTGLDRLLEYRHDDHTVTALIDDLSYGQCDFVLAVPNSWLDVTSVDDLADLALEFRQQGKQLRIATKYPRLLRHYLFDRGINYFTLVPASGALEAAPAAGYADLIADVSATGTTMRENQLKMLEEGTILASQACLIGNINQLKRSKKCLQLARSIMELMEAHLQAEPFYRITANVQGASPQGIQGPVLAGPDRLPVRSRFPSVNGIATTLAPGQIRLLASQEVVLQIENDDVAEPHLDTAAYWSGVQRSRLEVPAVTGAGRTIDSRE